MDNALVDRLRAQTPACEKIIHFNNAGAALMPDPVWDAMQGHLTAEREIGGYEAAAAADLDAFYAEFAALLNAKPSEIAYVENATRAWDAVFYGLDLGEGDRVLTHASEYVSNYLAFLQLAKSRGVEVNLIPSDGAGAVDADAIAPLITSRTKLIAITHIPTQGGLVNPAEAVGKVAREHGIFYLLDACQSAGQMPLDVQAIGCDALSGTGRKFLRGPRGTGFLWVSEAAQDRVTPPMIDLRAARWIDGESYDLAPDATRYENWESFVAGRVGLSVAVRYAREIGLQAIEARVTGLAASLRDRLGGVAGVSVRDLGTRKSGIVTLTKHDEAAGALQARLLAAGINTSVSHLGSARLDFGARGIDDALRASLHYYNTDAEIDRFIAVLEGAT